ncbi:MAG: A/G-specific adenine glycosylase [Desulforhopalus sp.]|nr:A/G-specific adenine glycosylase [Desulforhopalus sp.]
MTASRGQKNLETESFARLADILISWYRQTRRPLPWRGTWDPYHIWISEIMLQQTQMERGVEYFNRWIATLPDVAAVANADEQLILRLWQGLGYYARARNLHRAAEEIVARFNGIVPHHYNDLLSLPGIGPYTAAAVASIAGNHDVAVVDANVGRVYSRLFDIAEVVKSGSGEKRVRELAEAILPHGRARYYNEAIMDFGGLLCTAKAPKCGSCPLAGECLALQHGVVDERPVTRPEKARVVEKKLIGLIRCGERFLIRYRVEGRLWAGLWDFPGTLLFSEVEKGFVEPAELSKKRKQELLSAAADREVQVVRHVVTVKHQYTHHKRTVECWLCTAGAGSERADEKWVTLEEMGRFAFPAGARKVLEYLLKRDFDSSAP